MNLNQKVQASFNHFASKAGRAILSPSHYARTCFSTVRTGRFREEFRIAIDQLHLSSIKNSLHGNRGFVIGNGPSLQVADLDRLKNEITIASNKIYLAFKETGWRPNYYTIVDHLVWDKIASSLDDHFEKVYIPNYLKTEQSPIKTIMWRHLDQVSSTDLSTPEFSDDATRGFYGGHSVTYENLQFAVHLGLNPIYLIGCDHYYAGEKEITNGEQIKVKAPVNHFSTDYRSEGELVNRAPIAQMTNAYHHANEFAKRNSIKILNATRGGHLEVFPRKSFDALF